MVAPRRRVARISDQSNVERRRSPCAADRFSETANAAASFGATWRFAGSSYNSARDRVLFRTWRRLRVLPRLAVGSLVLAIEVTSSGAVLRVQPTDFRRLPMLLPTSELRGASPARSTVACDWHAFKRGNGCVSRSAAPYSRHTGRLVQYRATPISGCDRQVS